MEPKHAMRTARDINAQMARQFRADESNDHALQAGLQQQLAAHDALVAQIGANEPNSEKKVRAEVALALAYPDGFSTY